MPWNKLNSLNDDQINTGRKKTVCGIWTREFNTELTGDKVYHLLRTVLYQGFILVLLGLFVGVIEVTCWCYCFFVLVLLFCVCVLLGFHKMLVLF